MKSALEFKYKDIFIGKIIKDFVQENDISTKRICLFLKITDVELEKMYTLKNMDTNLLMRWCKLLEYDFFRIYSQHLLLYAPPKSIQYKKTNLHQRTPSFRKNVYTTEIIQYIMELIETKQKTASQIIKDYRIPKTTLYKWIKKHLK